MDDDSEIWDILAKKVGGESLSPIENAVFEKWLREKSAHGYSYHTLSQLEFSQRLTENGADKEEVFIDITNKIYAPEKAKRLYSGSLKVAVIAILIIVSSAVFFKLGKDKTLTRYATYYTPKGVRSQVVLPDGTQVVLNAGTNLKYPLLFQGKTREVELNGEAYFDVVHNSERPFIVKTNHVEVVVLGTKFNLKSYSNDIYIETTLERGKVQVKDLVGKNMVELAPGRQAVFNTRTNNFRVDAVDPGQIYAWKNGNYFFKSKPFIYIAHVLEREFNVSIKIESERLRKEVFSGDFVSGESLEQILSIIQRSSGMVYSINGQEITITEK